MANDNRNDKNRLIELGGSDYKVADGNPNIKGWDVKDAAGRKFGKVDELIFSPSSKKVRYLVLDLNKNDFDLKSRNVLVPIGKANLHEKDDDVILSSVTGQQLEELPEYEKGKINSGTESRVRSVFSGTAATTDTATAAEYHEDDFYEHDDFDEDRFYGKRRKPGSESIPVIEENLEIGKRETETGGAQVRTSIEEHDVEKSINLKEEHVNVNRTPTDRPATDKDLENFEEGEKRITAHKEVPIVDKEARVVEEVNINKEVTEDEKTIRDTVKKTEVDTENLHNNDRDNPNHPSNIERDSDIRNTNRDNPSSGKV